MSSCTRSSWRRALLHRGSQIAGVLGAETPVSRLTSDGNKYHGGHGLSCFFCETLCLCISYPSPCFPLTVEAPAHAAMKLQSASLAAAALLLPTAAAVNSTVDLSYSKYRGVSLENGISQWLGIRFAAPPVGSLRFMPPRDPPRTAEVQEADKVSRARDRRSFMTLFAH